MNTASDFELKVAAATARNAIARLQEFCTWSPEDEAALKRVNNLLDVYVETDWLAEQDRESRGSTP